MFPHAVGAQNVDSSNIDRLYQSEAAWMEKLRQRLLREDHLTRRHLKDGIHPRFSEIFDNDDFMDQILNTSIPFSGCASASERVVGFYNVLHHAWILVWLDADGDIATVKSSLGFVPKVGPSDTGWFDIVTDKGSVVEAVRLALRIQLESFAELFAGSECRSPQEIDWLLTNQAAAATIWLNYQDQERVPKSFRASILNYSYGAYRDATQLIEKPSDIVEAMTLPNVLGADVASFLVLRQNQSALIVQTWKRDGDKMQLISADFGYLWDE